VKYYSRKYFEVWKVLKLQIIDHFQPNKNLPTVHREIS